MEVVKPASDPRAAQIAQALRQIYKPPTVIKIHRLTISAEKAQADREALLAKCGG